MLAVAGADQVVRVKDLAKGKDVTTFDLDSAITSLAFSPNGKLLAVGTSSDQTVWVWDLDEPGHYRSRMHFGGDAVAFDPDGSVVATVDRNTIYLSLWDTVLLEKETCSRVKRSLSSVEWDDYIRLSPQHVQTKTCRVSSGGTAQ